MQLSFFQRFFSHFYPVKVREASSNVNPVLELFFYKGQWQLATSDAIYSDGSRYRPLRYAFKNVSDKLPAVSTALVLGTGLGSAVQILDEMGCHPEMELVEIDPVIVMWLKELLPLHLQPNLTFTCEHAASFVQENKKRFDLIVVDIFEGRIVPSFVLERDFLERCRGFLCSGGVLILNYITGRKDEWERLQEIFREIFPIHHVHELGVNRVFIATV